MSDTLRHRQVRMSGRDPDQTHRAATTLELLFDLTFVVAFGIAANELAHQLAEDHVKVGLVGFVFATFGISWAWINFTWFASAYDTDDWIYRLTTMLQMVGVLIFALGITPMFKSIDHGPTLDNDVIVWGYVVMRVAMIAQWVRATKHDPGRRAAHRVYLVSIIVAQVLWCVIALVDVSVPLSFALIAIPLLIELVGPGVAEGRCGGTPWHPHHVAERYGLMVIIALGEGLIGTMVSLSALAEDGLTKDVALLAFAGTAMTFGLWWSYFVIPHGEILAARRERSFGWGYGHIPLFGAIVAIGAGLHVAAYYIDHHAHIGRTATVATIVVPLAFFTLALYVFYAVVSRSLDPFHLLLIVITIGVLVAPLLMAQAGASVTTCVLVLAAAPWVSVVGYETVGWRHNEAVLRGLED